MEQTTFKHDIFSNSNFNAVTSTLYVEWLVYKKWPWSQRLGDKCYMLWIIKSLNCLLFMGETIDAPN